LESVELLGVRLMGLTGNSLHKLALTAGVVVTVFVARLILDRGLRLLRGRAQRDRVAFWTRQGASLIAFAVIVLALASIWFDDPKQLQTAIGLVGAGLAVASQRAVTAFAGYLVIMRGKHFTVGDRIRMGGVQGDVISLGFLQTRILEMGQPPDITEQEPPGMWVRSRQFTGRIVAITNDKIFDEPVYNFTREFPYVWEEMRIGVGYKADLPHAEHILLDAALEVTRDFESDADAAREGLQRRYGVSVDDDRPRVYWRITDNWLELSVRFLVPDHGVREIKDRMARRILPALNEAGIDIASTTFEVVGLPPLRVERTPVRERRA
jgi:small-conductance mechanosensitive channel